MLLPKTTGGHYWEPIDYTKSVWIVPLIGKHAQSAIFFSHLRLVIVIYLSFVPLITGKLPVSELKALSALNITCQKMACRTMIERCSPMHVTVKADVICISPFYQSKGILLCDWPRDLFFNWLTKLTYLDSTAWDIFTLLSSLPLSLSPSNPSPHKFRSPSPSSPTHGYRWWPLVRIRPTTFLQFLLLQSAFHPTFPPADSVYHTGFIFLQAHWRCCWQVETWNSYQQKKNRKWKSEVLKRKLHVSDCFPSTLG